MFPKLVKAFNNFRWHHPVIFGGIHLAIFLFGLVVYRQSAFHQIGKEVSVNDLELEGLSYNEAYDVLDDHFQELQQTIIEFDVDGEPFRFTAADLGIKIDAYKTIENIYLSEFGESFWQGLKVNTLGNFDPIDVNPVVHYTADNTSDQLQAFLHNSDPDATISLIVAGKELNIPLYALDSTDDEETVYVGDPETTQEEEDSTGITADNVHWTQVYVPQPFTFIYDDGEAEERYTVRFNKQWLDYSVLDENDQYSVIDEEKIWAHINNKIAPEIDAEKEDANITTFHDGTDYVTLEGHARDGREVRVEESVSAFYAALEEDVHEIALVVEELPGMVIDQTGLVGPDLELIGTGRSNFETSPSGRDFNVRKGLNEKVQAIIVWDGDEYDFNSNLGPVTFSAGWQGSLAIFGGNNLVSVPGGGLCQVATTVYRAALDAGLPITSQSSHSLYVHYYIAYGEGLDAAIYPGGKNLKFTNDTGHPIIIQAYDDGYDGFVEVYGVDDGRDVELIGPFYPGQIDADYQDKIYLNSNQIGWWRTIKDANGNLVSEEQRTGTYRSIPY
jgi:vancomycin resistance protein YoaR